MRWAGQHDGHGNGKTLTMEAIADHRKCLWMTNFGDAGAMNDINVLDKSSIVGAMIRGSLNLKVPEHTINGNPPDGSSDLSLDATSGVITLVNAFSRFSVPTYEVVAGFGMLNS